MINNYSGSKFYSARNVLEVTSPTALQGKSDTVP